SPDQTKLLFALHNGTAGVFDIKTMKLLGTFEHGDAIWLKEAGIYAHHAILSGCFIDNTHFATAGDDGKIRIWDINQPKPTGVLNREQAFFYGLKLTPDGRYLVGTDGEKAIRFIDIKTGETAFSIISPDHESVAVISKDGYYTANKKGLKSLTFLRTGRAYDFSQFDLYLNRPDKVLEQFGYASPETINLYRKAFAKRMEKTDTAGISNKIFSPGYAAPDIAIKDLPDELAETAESSLKLVLSATDATAVISTLFVSVNGVPLYGTKGYRLKQAKAGSSLEIPLEIPLSSGNNAITISVMNRNKVESLRENINIRRTGAAPKPNLYMIAIGSGASLNKDKKLEFPAKDASDVAALLSRSPLFGKVQQTLLVNEKVTRPAFIKLKEQLLKTRPDDYVVVFYSGHGILDTALNYYLSTYDTDFSHPRARAIPYEDFENLLDSIPSRNKVLLLDACHSGEADREAMKGGFRTTKGDLQMEGGLAVKSGSRLIPGAQSSFHLMQSLFSDLRTSNGATIIAAAGASQYAVEGEPWKNGVFTYSLKSALEEKKADLNKDGIIYLSELLEYLQGRVVELTNGNQQPCSRKENIVNDLAIWQ
ncbi:MAG TPA: caspase family protein, partial [Chitinophaga sp.]